MIQNCLHCFKVCISGTLKRPENIDSNRKKYLGKLIQIIGSSVDQGIKVFIEKNTLLVLSIDARLATSSIASNLTVVKLLKFIQTGEKNYN